MITIIGYALRQSKEGKSFVALHLQGDMEMVQSQETGKFYATAKKCFITSTFDEPTAQTLIGQKMPGSIERVQCNPYEYTVPETGESIMLAHSYQYVPENKQAADASSRMQAA
jgi:hypothetical protein